MPRDGSGNYTLPAGNPVVTNTIITSTWANTTLADIAAQLNNVFTRDGLLGPTAPFKIVDGTIAAPGLAWNSEPGLGWYRTGAGRIQFVSGGGAVQTINGTNAGISSMSITPRAAGSGNISISTHPSGAADSRSLALGADNATGKVTIASVGAGALAAGPLEISGPTINLVGNSSASGNLQVAGQLMVPSLELGPTADGSSFIDFKNSAGDDFDFRIAQWGATPGWLRFIHNYGSSSVARFKFEGNGAGLVFDNIDTQPGSNSIAFGWRSDGRLGLRVDTTQFNANWPIDITGRSGSAGYADNAGALGGVGAGSFVVGDACRIVGFASQNSLMPYMRHGDQTTGQLRYIIWQTYNDGTVQRIALVGVNPGVNAVYEVVSSNGAAWGVTVNSSDERMKTKIAPSSVYATPVIRAMEFIEFASKAMPEKMYRLGFSAQKLRAQVEDFATEGHYREPDEEGGEPVLTPAIPNDLYILAYVAKALQESLAVIDDLAGRVAALEAA